ncbi:hypothetical protein BU16DRAFT_595157 [Lophium mytilinum]|uniref:Uncharacterized protein n=1 Tax=Lophium mytilinum TaxID=390894 RepID=A0A6A6QIJ0_9PEZI|nr:hypothetical protein BU16DRAFT_595157 [Lophium mytilinum]
MVLLSIPLFILLSDWLGFPLPSQPYSRSCCPLDLTLNMLPFRLTSSQTPLQTPATHHPRMLFSQTSSSQACRCPAALPSAHSWSARLDGENLLDHPESIIIWELNKPVPINQTTVDSDAGILMKRAHGRTASKLLNEAEKVRQVLSANSNTGEIAEGLDILKIRPQITQMQPTDMVPSRGWIIHSLEAMPAILTGEGRRQRILLAASRARAALVRVQARRAVN